MKITEILGVLALVLIFLRIRCLLRQRRKSRKRHGNGVKTREVPRYRIGSAGPTLITVEELTEEMMVYARFDVTTIPGTGVSISRPNSMLGDIKLQGSGTDAYTVAEEHVRIGLDAHGFYIQERDNGTANGMFLKDGVTRIGETDITDGMIVYLGSQPIRFRIPKRKNPNSRR